jgi:hypothetical protein
MAKPLGEKSRIIREAITANPKLGNTKVAALLNGHDDRKKDKLEFKAQDVAQQKVAMKKAAGVPIKRRKRKAAVKPAPAAATATKKAAPAHEHKNPVALVERVFALARDCGGMGALKDLVVLLAGQR